MGEIHQINNITELHKILQLAPPNHPLISIVDFSQTKEEFVGEVQFSTQLYSVMLKRHIPDSLKYGRREYDFQEGTLLFMSPGQLISVEADTNYQETQEGWGLFFHPDLLRKSNLSMKMDDFGFFSYNLNESLHLSEKEKIILANIIKQIEEELFQNIDSSSQSLILSNIELLLNYCVRFYNRQFITRSNFDGDYIVEFKKLLKQYFKEEKQKELGLPNVAYFASQLNLSPKYFSDLLKKETDRNAQSHIHEYILDRAKNKLLNTNDSISEIAYELGFEYPQYFSSMFKKKTGKSPLEFRNIN